MSQPTPKVVEMLRLSLLDMKDNPELSEPEIRWIEHFALRLMAAYSVVKANAAEYSLSEAGHRTTPVDSGEATHGSQERGPSPLPVTPTATDLSALP